MEVVPAVNRATVRYAALCVVAATCVLLRSASLADVATPDFIIPDCSLVQSDPSAMHTDYVVATRINLNGDPFGVPFGVSPKVLREYYGAPTAGQGAIAIVDAYDFNNALKDFNKYAAAAGIPLETSTDATASTNQVFQVVYANGKEPVANFGWNVEEAIDIEIAHAMAPLAKIYLVEAANNGGKALYAAVRAAADLPGVEEVSMSWGGIEYANEKATDSETFNTPGVIYLAASGDSGAGAQYPASSPNVIGVGGTRLDLNGQTVVSETGWIYSGGGRSLFEKRPAYQDSVKEIVGSKRGVPDIAADAAPDSGIGVFIDGGWAVYGGTSVATPLCAGILNDADVTPSDTPTELATIYDNLLTANFHDIVVGNNGHPCLIGYDLVTGVGSPNGLGGF
jgi:subtilase family serine protease